MHAVVPHSSPAQNTIFFHLQSVSQTLSIKAPSRESLHIVSSLIKCTVADR